jgi:hypothetical protein
VGAVATAPDSEALRPAVRFLDPGGLPLRRGVPGVVVSTSVSAGAAWAEDKGICVKQ